MLEDGIDGAPYEVKISRTVWVGGKTGDNIEGLPINIPKDKRRMDRETGRSSSDRL